MKSYTLRPDIFTLNFNVLVQVLGIDSVRASCGHRDRPEIVTAEDAGSGYRRCDRMRRCARRLQVLYALCAWMYTSMSGWVVANVWLNRGFECTNHDECMN
jgi:hypothetical protein